MKRDGRSGDVLVSRGRRGEEGRWNGKGGKAPCENENVVEDEMTMHTWTSLGDILSFLASSLRLGALGFLSLTNTFSKISSCPGVVRLRVLMVLGTYV